MRIFMRFPGFLKKALTFSYDDGNVADERLIGIFDRYGLHATFNLNSGKFDHSTHLNEEKLRELFASGNHEIAVHGYDHLSLTEVSPATATADVINDRLKLEATFGRIVRGMAYAYGDYNDRVVQILENCGIVYCRTTKSSLNFDIPTDWLRLSPTCHHANPKLPELTERFLTEEVNGAPRLFYIWGHSFEFDRSQNWSLIEDLAARLGNRDDIYYATNGQLYDYITAYRALITSADGGTVYNPTQHRLFFRFADRDVTVAPGETLRLL